MLFANLFMVDEETARTSVSMEERSVFFRSATSVHYSVGGTNECMCVGGVETVSDDCNEEKMRG